MFPQPGNPLPHRKSIPQDAPRPCPGLPFIHIIFIFDTGDIEQHHDNENVHVWQSLKVNDVDGIWGQHGVLWQRSDCQCCLQIGPLWLTPYSTSPISILLLQMLHYRLEVISRVSKLRWVSGKKEEEKIEEETSM